MKENLVTGKIARCELGRPGPPLGATFFSAVKRKMGLTGRRVAVSAVRRWMAEHPDFKLTDVYRPNPEVQKQQCPKCGLMVAVQRTAHGLKLRRHGARAQSCGGTI